MRRACWSSGLGSRRTEAARESPNSRSCTECSTIRRWRGAFFYFRSAEYAKASGGDYVDASEDDAARQHDLKDRIWASGFPVVDDYPDPEAFAPRLEEDLWAVLDEAFPADEVPRAFERESRQHEAYTEPNSARSSLIYRSTARCFRTSSAENFKACSEA
jgi:hypothetical protein